MHIISQYDSGFSQESRTVIENYKLSAFCIRQEADNGILLCHAATGALALLTAEEYEAVCAGGPLTEDWAQDLAAFGFLPDTDTDEYAQVDEKRALLQDNTAKLDAITSYTILPTSRCNARCFYCYENGIPQKNMTRKTAEDVAQFIIQSSKGKPVHLGWFGGEPTVAHPTITLICQHLREQNVDFHSGMISNGLLLDEALIRTAREQWNLRHVQITIDGTESVYNATKNYKGTVENPYLTVLSHIDALLDANIQVSVRINLGLHNFEDISLLIQQLTPRYSNRKQIMVYVHEIDNYYNEAQYLELMARTDELNNALVQAGLHRTPDLPTLRLHSCMADNDESVLINPDGQLGKCEHFVFEKLHGSIYSQEKDTQILRRWKAPVQFEQCHSCPFYAACLRLEWCNGGNFFCKDGMIQSKLAQTRHTMLQIYENWKVHRCRFRESDSFQLAQRYELREADGQLCAVFPAQEQGEPPVTIPVNQTSLDILDILQQLRTFPDVVGMLNEKYDTAGFAVADIVEDYLLSLIQSGLCSHKLAEPVLAC